MKPAIIKYNKALMIINCIIVILMLVVIAIRWSFLPDHLKTINVNGNNGNNKIYLFVMPGVVAVMTLIVYLLFLLGKAFTLKKRKENKNSWDEEAQMYKSQKNNMNRVTNGVVTVTNGVIYTIATYINSIVTFCSIIILIVFFAVIFQINLI
ncbi:hypothetical protein BCR32DRAFT_288950 [Anaeromyces robustus]|uniref:Uncharacterized protein n=1 Tax=Anaeromyces robustus TaxID=1754192 RepID=A0A1Y1XRU0_9FUNG|nr:hypothetical protein BCR32DRAFT_288950 [Anaeromyces robustus]|eukprot:ORX88014.1 hypothetical protein BCR32DRAFT_288950 [Anaeromyces robustus]